MLRKRSRSVQKTHQMSDSASDSCFQLGKLGQKQKNTSFFSIPGLFVGFNVKGVSDSDAVRSPTSPLDYKLVSKLGNPRSSPNGLYKSWDSSKVGLGIVDSLDNVSKSSENVVGLSGSRNILFGSQMRMNFPSPQSRLYRLTDSSVMPKSLPENCPIFSNSRSSSLHFPPSGSESSYTTGENQSEPKPSGNIRSYFSDSSRSLSRLSGMAHCNNNSSSKSFSLDNKTKPGFLLTGESSNLNNSLGIKPCSLPISIGSGNVVVGSLSAREIELSEDYTCIISHGPNPRTTHIFGDCVLECHAYEQAKCTHKKEEEGIRSPQPVKVSNSSLSYPLNDFLSFCYFCKKKLEEGNDIYMYRGEKAFCSCTCRDQEMLAEEETEKVVHNSPSDSPKSTASDDIFIMGMI